MAESQAKIGLSLSPREDQVRISLPRDFLPKEVEEKYTKIINRGKSVILSPIDYLNESIQTVSIPGISDITVEQEQPGGRHGDGESYRTARHINAEGTATHYDYTPTNILSKIDREITIQMRKNQGLYNYLMLYETAFYKVCKPFANRPQDDLITIELLNESGNVTAKIKIMQPRLQGIDGIQFSYNKQERSTDLFDVKFKFNNIDIDFY